MSPDAPPIGSMQLYDSVTPGMSSGLHRVTTAVRFLPTTGVDPALTTAVHRDWVEVGGSALHFQPTEVLGCHPPRNATGGFGEQLPHIVLSRRTLPWERPGPNGSAPWLALLVFADDEVTFASGRFGDLLPGPLVTAFGTDGAAPDAPTDVVQVNNAQILAGILPTQSEVGLLCHVRRVNTADSALDLADDDGWLAVVVANRLPIRPADGPGRYHACLVSLEHRQDLYTGPQSLSLVLLYRWDFITDTDGTFDKLCQDLDVGTLGTVGTGAPAVADPDGRVTLNRTSREGATDVALYRGPFTVSSAAATPQDNDVSYDSAFELGRLLAAADGPLTRELVDWHRASAALIQTDLQHAGVRALATRSLSDASLVESDPTHVRAAAAGLELLLRSLAPHAPHRPSVTPPPVAAPVTAGSVHG